MKRSRCWNAVFSTFAALSIVLIPVLSRAATKTCLTGDDPEVVGDAADINAVRALVDSACACASFDGSKGKTHGAYVKCAADIINAQAEVPPGALRRQCKGKALQIYAQSTCGSNPALHKVVCLKRVIKSGKLSCAIKPTTKGDGVTPTNACVAGPTFAAGACSDSTHCLQAADTNHDLLIAAPGDTGECQCPYSRPFGSYAGTCINCSVSSSCDLTCVCAPNGTSVFSCPESCYSSSLRLPCAGDVANIDGQLRCQ